MIRILLSSVLMVGLAALLGGLQPVQALPITGDVGFIGAFDPIDSLGNPVALGSATGIDFLGAVAAGATGDLASSIGFLTPAVFTDFQFFPILDPDPVNPLWSAGTFQFVLSSVAILTQSDQFLALEGTGTMLGAGFEDTAYGWSFSGDGNGGTFSFSSNNAPQSVPEPSTLYSMMFLGLGVFGGSAWNRRRRGNKEGQV